MRGTGKHEAPVGADQIWRVERPWREVRPVSGWLLVASLYVAAGVVFFVVATVAILFDTAVDWELTLLFVVVLPLAVLRGWRWTRNLGTTELVAGTETLTVRRSGDEDRYAWSLIASIEVVGPERVGDRVRQLVAASPGFARVVLTAERPWGDPVAVKVLVTRPETTAELVDFLQGHADARGILLSRRDD